MTERHVHRLELGDQPPPERSRVGARVVAAALVTVLGAGVPVALAARTPAPDALVVEPTPTARPSTAPAPAVTRPSRDVAPRVDGGVRPTSAGVPGAAGPAGATGVGGAAGTAGTAGTVARPAPARPTPRPPAPRRIPSPSPVETFDSPYDPVVWHQPADGFAGWTDNAPDGTQTRCTGQVYYPDSPFDPEEGETKHERRGSALPDPRLRFAVGTPTGARSTGVTAVWSITNTSSDVVTWRGVLPTAGGVADGVHAVGVREVHRPDDPETLTLTTLRLTAHQVVTGRVRVATSVCGDTSSDPDPQVPPGRYRVGVPFLVPGYGFGTDGSEYSVGVYAHLTAISPEFALR